MVDLLANDRQPIFSDGIIVDTNNPIVECAPAGARCASSKSELARQTCSE